MAYDLIVVGLGAMGSATLYQAAKSGAQVVGIDRYAPPHHFGSSHAETRITRLAVAEGAPYLPFVARSHQIWRALETQTGRPLLYQTGGYVVTPADGPQSKPGHWVNFVARTAAIAAAENIPFSRPAPAEVRARYPYVLLQDRDQVGFEPSAGVVLSERAIETQLAMAGSLGARIQLNTPVTDIKFEADSVAVSTRDATYHAGKAILAAGPWLPAFIPASERKLLRVTRQVVYWFEVNQPEKFSTAHFPFFIWLDDRSSDVFGIFPMPPNGVPGLKMLTEQFETTTDPSTIARQVRQAEIDGFYQRFVARKLQGVTANCVKAVVCMYTNTPDDHFAVDYHPHSKNVIVVSACSGHGFKHSAALGEALAQLALNGHSELDLTPFSFNRFSPSAAAS